MGWNRPTRRASARLFRRPDLESLEVRNLLSASSANLPLDLSAVVPASTSYKSSSNGFDAIVGASTARDEFKVDGKGHAVAVIDAGVNYNNPALGGGYSTDKKVIGGYDFAEKDADPFAGGLQHGTAVAGLIASADPSYPGVAPGADIVALRVFNDADKSSFTHVADALQWVVDNHETLGITVVNVSLSDGRNYSRNWYANDGGVGERISGLVTELKALKVPVVTATGNSFAGQEGSGFVSIIADSISVTATDGGDRLVADAQRLGPGVGGESATDLAAPGAGLFAPLNSKGFSEVSGTSFAAPLVSGAIVLIQQVYQSRFGELPSVSDVDAWLKKSAEPIKDPVTGITIGRLDIPKALSLIPTPAAQELKPPAPPVVVTPPPVVVVVPPPVVVAPPPVVVVVPEPVVVSPGPVEPTPAPAVVKATEKAPAASNAPQVWLNGRSVPAVEIEAPDATAPSSFLTRVLGSFRDWWSGPTTKVRVWAASPAVDEPQAAGAVTQVAVPRAEAVTHGPATRPWRSFVNSRRQR